MAKYCVKCNHFFEDDGTKFCSVCGSSEFVPFTPNPAPDMTAQTKSEVPVQPEEPAAPAQSAESAEPVQPAAPVQATEPVRPVMPSFDTIPAAKPKKKLSFKKIAFIAIPVILVIAIVLNMSAIAGLFTRLFGSDRSYFSYVEKKSVADFNDTFSEYYDNYLLDDILKDSEYKVKFELDFGDDLKSSIKDQMGGQIDVEWLDDTDFDLTLNTKDKKAAQEILLGIGGQHVLTTSALFDFENNKVLLSLKEITDDILKFDLENSGSSEDIISGITGENRKLAAEILPKTSVVTDLISKYHGIIIENIKDIKKDTEDVEINGIKEKLTVLKADISEKNLKDMSLAILGELRDDKQIKKIIENTKEVYKKNGIADDSLKTYEEFTKEINELIKEAEGEDTAEDKIVLTIFDYVNSDDKIVGRKIGEKGEALNYVTVESGKKFAAQAVLEDGIEYKGEGTKNGDRITGEYTFEQSGETLYKLSFTDFDKKAFKKGKIDGKIRFFPNSAAIKNAAPGNFKSFASMLDIAFEIDAKGDSDSGKFNLTFYNGEKQLLKADGNYSISGSGGVKEPGGKQLEIKGLESLQELLGDLHLEQLVANLRKTTVPKEYVDAIEQAAKELKDAG